MYCPFGLEICVTVFNTLYYSVAFLDWIHVTQLSICIISPDNIHSIWSGERRSYKADFKIFFKTKIDTLNVVKAHACLKL